VQTIKSSLEIDSIFRESRRVSTALVTALVRQTPEGRGRNGRVAFVAGKRLGNAVFRNRSKRVLRAAVSRTGRSWAGFDVVLIANTKTGSCDPRDLDRSLETITRNSGFDR
jgi:ribonuclease P protein component